MTASSAPTPQDAGRARLFDLERGLEAMGSDESLTMILESVIESLNTSLPEIDRALQAGDVATANDLLHALKGYMPILATDLLIEQVTQVEGASKTGTAAEIQPMYAALAPLLAQLLTEIEQHVASGSSGDPE